MRRRMGKAMTAFAAAVLTVSMGVAAFAGSWQQNGTGWWYATDGSGKQWYKNGWQWIDGNGDGMAEHYYFDENGYLLMDRTTPDGKYVNGDGAEEAGGVVVT